MPPLGVKKLGISPPCQATHSLIHSTSTCLSSTYLRRQQPSGQAGTGAEISSMEA